MKSWFYSELCIEQIDFLLYDLLRWSELLFEQKEQVRIEPTSLLLLFPLCAVACLWSKVVLLLDGG